MYTDIKERVYQARFADLKTECAKMDHVVIAAAIRHNSVVVVSRHFVKAPRTSARTPIGLSC